jgi:predicted nucleic acid-binding protein
MARVRYLLDTNVLSEPVVARPNPFVLDFQGLQIENWFEG